MSVALNWVVAQAQSIRATDLDGPNPTSLLPGAISLAETVVVKDYW